MDIRRGVVPALACIVVLAAPPSVEPVAGKLVAPPPFELAWGSPGSGSGQFSLMDGVAVDSAGSVFVVDSGNHRVEKFTSAGAYVLQWGGHGTGIGQFSYPAGIAVAPNGHIHVVDSGNDRVQSFTANGSWLRSWGEPGTGHGQFSAPNGVAVDGAGNIYVVDSGNHRVQKFGPTGAYQTSWGSFGATNGLFHAPIGIAVDSVGDVYVSDAVDRVQVFSPTGAYKRTFGSSGSGSGQLSSPWGIAVDASDRVHVVDLGNDRIQVFSALGAPLVEWGARGTANGEFRQPRWVATAASGHVFVVDAENFRVQRFGGDVSGPTVTITRPVDGAAYPRGLLVNAAFSCVPHGGVAIRSCIGTVADGTPVDTSTLGEHEFTVVAVDVVSRRSTATNIYTVVDVTDPSVTIDRPGAGAAYPRGAVVTASYTCRDEAGGSGLASCTGTVRDGAPIETTLSGVKRFTVTAVDGAGNEAARTHRYTVASARPDARIEATPGGDLVGNDVYGRGDGQRVDRLAVRGSSTTYVASIQNDAPFPDRLRVTGLTDGQGFAVRYLDADGADISSEIESVGHVTRRLAPGAVDLIRMRVTTSSGAPAGAVLEIRLAAVSTTHAVQDEVRAVTHSKPDTVAPSAVIRRPAHESVIPRGADVTADYSCADPGGWGVRECTGTVPDGRPIDTSAVGDREFRVIVTDWAGHPQRTANTYTVALGRPDGLIACAGAPRPCMLNPIRGNDVYNADGRNQTQRRVCLPGQVVTHRMLAQNDAEFAEALTVAGQPSATGFAVTYLDASGEDVTSAVTSGTFHTPRLGPGERYRFSAEVRCRSLADTGTELQRTVRIMSSNHPHISDTVVFVVVRG